MVGGVTFVVLSLDSSAASTTDKAAEEQEPRQAICAWESHRRCREPDVTAAAVALHHAATPGKDKEGGIAVVEATHAGKKFCCTSPSAYTSVVPLQVLALNQG